MAARFSCPLIRRERERETKACRSHDGRSTLDDLHQNLICIISYFYWHRQISLGQVYQQNLGEEKPNERGGGDLGERDGMRVQTLKSFIMELIDDLLTLFAVIHAREADAT